MAPPAMCRRLAWVKVASEMPVLFSTCEKRSASSESSSVVRATPAQRSLDFQAWSGPERVRQDVVSLTAGDFFSLALALSVIDRRDCS